MLTLALLTLFTAPSEAAAPKIFPELGQKSCFARKYDADHMRIHSRQKLSAMHVLVKTTRETSDNGDGTSTNYDLTTARVVGEKNGVPYGNEAYCDKPVNGVVKCQIECDGGAFTLAPVAGGKVQFHVADRYYFPLYKQGFDRENADEHATISLDDKDRENNAYNLSPAEAAACEKEWARYKTLPGGC